MVERLNKKRGEIRPLFVDIVDEGQPITTSVVAKKEERAYQILVDSSSMKPAGDVRAPFSIRYKAGLASPPIPLEEFSNLNIDDAHPLNVIKRVKRHKEAVKVQLSSPVKLIPK